MPTVRKWEERYESGSTPWDTGRPDEHLIRTVREHPIVPSRALEVGCGTGTNAVWLAEQGFEVLATDVAARAIARARRRVEQAGVQVTLLHGSFPKEGGTVDFVFDRGCFHSFDGADERASFAAQVAEQLGADGLWLSIIGSTDGPPRDHGPPRRSAADVVQAVEPHFEILSLQSAEMDANVPTVPRIWLGLMKKRTS